MLIPVTTTTTKTETREVNLPLYFKNKDQFFALLDEKKMTTVYLYDTPLVMVSKPYGNDIANVLSYEEITKDDFDFAFEMAIDRLRKANNYQPQKEAV